MKQLYILTMFLFLAYSSAAIGQNDAAKDVRSHLRVNKTEVKLYPNPATNRFSISIPGSQVKYITINNIIGKKIRRVAVDPNNKYDVSDLQRGIYIIRIFDHSDNLIKALRLSKT